MMRDETARHRLYDRLVEVLGDQEAATLMRSLPPSQADELATRRDLEGVADRLEHRIARLEDRLDQQTRTFVVTSIGSLATMGALAFAAASLI